jgi:branched-chain amino acid transport system ATP-binding protein
MLTLSSVQTHIGAYHILHGVDLHVTPGKITVLLGRNGVGKSTTLRTIMGLWQASAGTLHFNGEQIGGPGAQLKTPQIARLGVAYVPENMGIFADLTVKENIVLAAFKAKSSQQLNSTRLDWIFDLFPALKIFWLHPAGLLSGGQKQMLAVARAIIEPRAMLLIDEPSKGLAPSIVNNLGRAFEALRAEGTSVLLVEQNFHFASRFGDYVAVMDNGRIVHSGAMQTLREDAALQSRLLGLSA